MKFAFAVVLLVSTPVHAAPQAVSPKKKDSIARFAAAFADCLVKHKHDPAARVILSNADNEEIIRRYRSLIDATCLSNKEGGEGGMTFFGDAFRYALADALVRSDLKGRDLGDLKHVPPLDHLAVEDAGDENGSFGRQNQRRKNELDRKKTRSATVNYLSRYGECIVRADAAGVGTMLATGPGTEEEIAKLRALMPSLSACMPEGMTLAYSRFVLRGILALNYYRLAFAPAASASLPVRDK